MRFNALLLADFDALPRNTLLVATPAATASQLHHNPRRWGIFTPLNATVATWSFHTVKADGGGPADYSDALTFVQNGHLVW